MNVFHLFGIFFVVLLVMVPNAFLSFDAAVPTATSKNGTSLMKVDYFGQEHQQAFGSGLLKEQYWVDAFDWLNEQDLDIEDPTQRPAFISWWDYGFYASAVSGHPTVADNFQSGIPPAANFHTARNEKEAVAVLTIRLMEGDMDDNDGVLSSSVVEILEKHLGENETVNVTTWMENPELSPSYNAPIGAEYDKNLSEIWRVAEQWDANAYYHDVVRTINETLDDEGATWLYHDIQGATGNSIRYYGVEGYDRFIFNIFAFLSDKSIYIPAQRSIYIGIPASMLTANPEDDFKSLIYTVRSQQDRSGRAMYPQHDNKDYSFAELKALNKQEQESVFVSNIREQRKEAYYETMVYNVYMGNHPFREQEQYKNLQLPCWGMKHFYAEYISTKYPYPGSNPPIPAVVIAKYYEGAFVNGTVTANNTPLNFVQVVCFDQYGIPHDNILTDAQGKFKLMVPAGNITIQLSYLGEVPLTSVTFNSTNDTMYSPITDDEAMRLTDNYTREINITVDLASIDGYIYEDINNNGSYEPDVDMPLSDVTVQPRDELGLFRNPAPVITDETGYYSFKDLFPSKYIISVLQDEFELHGESIPVTPGYQSYNVSKPQPGDIEGTVFFDTNNTGSYDPGEEMSGVTVDLFYQRNNRLIDRITTEHTGNYSFRSLIPGEYLLNATVQNTTTGYLNYIREEQITIEENTTTSFDIQLDYATISVSGHTTYETTNIANMSISFSPDPSVENNTATHANAKSDTEGFYRIRLDPGTYNLIVSELVNESGIDVTYSFSGNLTLAQGLGIKTFDIRLARTEE